MVLVPAFVVAAAAAAVAVVVVVAAGAVVDGVVLQGLAVGLQNI